MSQIEGAVQTRIEQTTVERIIDLRHRTLRSGMPIEAAHFPGDEEADTLHYAAFLAHDGTSSDIIICCASFMLNSYETVPAWQLRGMATENAYQGKGIGGELLRTAEEQMATHMKYFGIKMMWCNAREPAVKFYERNGWERVSDVFDIPNAGPHYKMIKDI